MTPEEEAKYIIYELKYVVEDLLDRDWETDT